MNGMTPELNRENAILLMVLRALTGVLSPAVKGVSLEFIGADVIAHFLLRRRSAVDEEEITENLTTEVSTLTNGLPDLGEIVVRPVIELVDELPSDYRLPGRVVFLFRD